MLKCYNSLNMNVKEKTKSVLSIFIEQTPAGKFQGKILQPFLW